MKAAGSLKTAGSTKEVLASADAKDKDKDGEADGNSKGNRRGKKNEDPDVRHKRVYARWRRAVSQLTIRWRNDQLKALKDFVFIDTTPPDAPKSKFSSKRRPAEIAAEEALKAKRAQQEIFVVEENLRYQWRMGMNCYYMGDYFRALEFMERVSLKKQFVYETDEEKAARLKEEKRLEEQKKFEELQERSKKKKLKGRKAEEARQLELDRLERIEREKREAEKKKRREAAARRKAGQTSDDEEEEEKEEEDPYSKRYDIHLWCGRCCVRLFESTKQHYHLENAYAHYTRSIECMTVPRPGYDMSTMLRLPAVLFELGQLYEHFGAHEAALQMYTKIMSEYPHCRVYFDVMYRAALAGKHLVDITTKVEAKAEMLNKCIDMLQFLLEALPHSLNETHVIFLYARCLEQSTEPAVRYRASGAYDSLFQHCKLARKANADKFETVKEWEKEPLNWHALAEEIALSHEPLLAKEGFETYVNKVNNRRGPGKELASYIETDVLVQIAMNYAHFQNFGDATKYADMALGKDRLNKRVRHLLSTWSKSHADRLKKEVQAVNTLHRHWSERAWTQSSRNKLRINEVHRLEGMYTQNRFNKEARSLLSYYARDEWRAKFLFENACAIRVQRFIRSKIQCWKVQEKFREKYLSRASQAYSMFNRRPYDAKLRQEIKAICSSRFCPRKHAIRRVRGVLELQDNAVAVLRRTFTSYRTRRRVMQGILNTKRRRDEHIWKCATSIQCLVRVKLACLKCQAEMKFWARKAVAAKVVQAFIRYRNRTFKHCAWKLIMNLRRAKERAFATFRIIMAYHIKRKLERNHAEYAEKQRELVRQERIRKYNFALERRNNAVKLMQRFFKGCRARLLSIIASRTIRARRATGFSQTSRRLLDYFTDYSSSSSSAAASTSGGGYSEGKQEAEAEAKAGFAVPAAREGEGGGGSDASGLPSPPRPPAHIAASTTASSPSPFSPPSTAVGVLCTRYVIPGVRQTSSQFKQALQQRVVFITASLEPAECMMLSSLLRHPDCCVAKLILHDIERGYHQNFEFDLLPAIAKCRSLRFIRLLGGVYTAAFLQGLYAIVQQENARIIEIYCERVRTGLGVSSSSSSRGGSAAANANDLVLNLWQAGTTDKERQAARELGHTEIDVRSHKIKMGDVDEDELNTLQEGYLKFQQGSKALTSTFVNSVSRLILDYFNYSVPGIRSLSLHGASIRDADLPSICSGLLVNRSLRSLVLSLNIITDPGLLTLLAAVEGNAHSALEHLDVSNNLIAFGRAVRLALDAFTPPNVKAVPTLFLNVVGNSLARDYPDAQLMRKLKKQQRQGGGGGGPAASPSLLVDLRKAPPLIVITSYRLRKLTLASHTSHTSPHTTAAAAAGGVREDVDPTNFYGHGLVSGAPYSAAGADILNVTAKSGVSILENLESEITAAACSSSSSGSSSSSSSSSSSGSSSGGTGRTKSSAGGREREGVR